MHTFYISNFINIGQRIKTVSKWGRTKNVNGIPKTALLKIKTYVDLPQGLRQWFPTGVPRNPGVPSPITRGSVKNHKWIMCHYKMNVRNQLKCHTELTLSRESHNIIDFLKWTLMSCNCSFHMNYNAKELYLSIYIYIYIYCVYI